MEPDRTPPKQIAKKLSRILKKEQPDYHYLKKVFAYVREELELYGKQAKARRLPDLLTAEELRRFCDVVRAANHRVHTVMIKLLMYTGLRNAELANLLLDDVDFQGQRVRVQQGKGKKDRYVPFPASFRGELAQYIMNQRARGCTYLFETHRMDRFTTRWIREIVRRYAAQAGIEKRIYPHLFRHQLLTHLARKGILDAKIQIISGHSDRQSLAIYQDLSLADIEHEYQGAMQDFPVL
jgi:integrase/recombinase XerD